MSIAPAWLAPSICRFWLHWLGWTRCYCAQLKSIVDGFQQSLFIQNGQLTFISPWLPFSSPFFGLRAGTSVVWTPTRKDLFGSPALT